VIFIYRGNTIHLHSATNVAWHQISQIFVLLPGNASDTPDGCRQPRLVTPDRRSSSREGRLSLFRGHPVGPHVGGGVLQSGSTSPMLLRRLFRPRARLQPDRRLRTRRIVAPAQPTPTPGKPHLGRPRIRKFLRPLERASGEFEGQPDVLRGRGRVWFGVQMV